MSQISVFGIGIADLQEEVPDENNEDDPDANTNDAQQPNSDNEDILQPTAYTTHYNPRNRKCCGRESVSSNGQEGSNRHHKTTNCRTPLEQTAGIGRFLDGSYIHGLHVK